MCIPDEIAFKMNKAKVDIDLTMAAKESERLAIIARDELMLKINNHKKEMSENEKIELYKKAILQLKQEGKL